MCKYDFECQNEIFGPSSNVKIIYSATVRMSKHDFECQNAILGPNGITKYDFECRNAKFGLISNVKTGFRMSK